MVTTNRAVYTATHKAKVLDRAKELGSVADAAREYGHEPGLVYGWRHVEPGIRKAAKKDMALAERLAAKAAKNGAAAGASIALGNGAPNGKHGPPPPRDVALSNVVTKKAAPSEPLEPPHVDGPKMSVHALGPWLRDVVKQELPGAIDGQLERLINEKLGNLDERLEEAVRQALKKGLG